MRKIKRYFSARKIFFLVAWLFLASLFFLILKVYPDSFWHLAAFFCLFFLFNLFFCLGIFGRFIRSLILSLFFLSIVVLRFLKIDNIINILLLGGFLFVVWRLLEKSRGVKEPT